MKGDNPLAGPFYIEGADQGDTLAVKILDLQVDGDTGVGAFSYGFGALNETNYTPMLHPPLPEKIWFITLIMRPMQRRLKLRIRFFGEDSLASFFRLHWRRAGGGRGAELGGACRVRRQHMILPRPAWAIQCIFR